MISMTRALPCLLLLSLTAACNRRDGQTDGGAGGGGTGGSGAEGGAGGASAQSAEPLASEAVEATAATISLAAPLFLGGDQLRQEQDSADDNRAQDLVEDAVATNSIVTEAACVTFDWSGLTASITFTDCTLEATGLPLDGGITFTVTINPTSFALDFEQLTMGPSTVDGSVAVSFTGDGMLGRTTTADLTLSDGAETTHFTLTGGRLDVEAGSVSANGSGTISTSALDAAYEVDDVSWAQGDRCPSGGTLALDQEGLPNVTVTFLPTTPSDGAVEVQIGSFPSFTEVLAFCAP